ncbi:unnamed protein product [Pocillopora meandrina]|uniref:Uncharacterized protein n=1 Tax=Pocillopora meandrina TaxID=46732 RepID=A0AAU9WEP2_9CNID|nr:unnamed protein product [Pocillopora meandrina]
MSLINNLSSTHWQEVGNSSSDGLEFKEYIITRSQKDGSIYKYAVRAADDNDAPPRIFHLEGGDERKDPLKEYRMLEIVTRADGNKVFITGIRNGGDCVVKI